MRMSDLLDPLEVEEFLDQYFGRALCRLPGTPDRFRSILTLDDIRCLVNFHHLSPEMMSLTRNGRSVPASLYTDSIPRYPDQTSHSDIRQHLIRPSRFLSEIKNGASLVINSLEEIHEPAFELAELLEDVLEERVYINAYISWGTTSGFKKHSDDHEVIVLQLYGRKHWEVTPEPETAGEGTPCGSPLSFVLSDGDFLHVPRGWHHLVTPLDELSVHLTIGVMRRTDEHLLAWLLEELRAEGVLTAAVPRRGDGDERAAHLARLRRAVGERLDRPGLLEDYLGSCAENRHMRGIVELPG